MTTEEAIKRLDNVLGIGDNAIKNKIMNPKGIFYIPESLYYGFKASAFEIIELLKGKESRFYVELEHGFRNNWISHLETAMNILHTLRGQAVNGYLKSADSEISEDIFEDFLGLSQHFIDKGWYDAAAVMAGGVLEGHLRKLCIAHEIPVATEKDGKITSKGANHFNDDLRKKEVYSKKYKEFIDGLIGIRNDGAHTDKNKVDKTRAEMLLHDTEKILLQFPLP